MNSEQNFHNNLYQHDTRKELLKYYKYIKHGSDKFYQLISEKCLNKDMLELGCGIKPLAPKFAQKANKITAIDISDIAIKNVGNANRQKNIRYLVMNANKLDFSNNEFDIIFGCGILHHLRIKSVLSNIKRIIKPDGKIFFLEPMGMNPAINLFRKFTPQYRTKSEHPLTVKDLEIIKSKFNETKYHYYYFLTLLPIVFGNNQKLINVFYKIDSLLFKIFPPLRLLSWVVVVEIDANA